MNDDPHKPKKDSWEKADVLAKIAIPVLIGMLGLLGNQYLSKKQEQENSTKLFTQLLNDKEASENTLRKDMFSQIINSFIGNKDDKQNGVEQIDKMLLSLELLSRNFHESLDMKPLFQHMMMDIVSQRKEIREPLELLKLEYFNKKNEASLGDAIIKASSALKRSTGHKSDEKNEFINIGVKDHKKIEDLIESLTLELIGYNGEIAKLVDIAKRVSVKQCEVLGEVSKKIKISFPAQEQKTNMLRSQNQGETPLFCQVASKDSAYLVQEDRLVFQTLAGEDIPGSARHFKIWIRDINPKKRSLLVDVQSWPCLEKGANKNCENCRKKANGETATFSVDHFAFPLVDNTYIDDEYRYSIILDDFNVNKDNPDKLENVTISLLYYPASYAGLKEKSFYNNRLLNKLLKSDMFQKGAKN